MTLEQANLLQQRLAPLEGVIAKETREYIWKILIGPKDPGQSAIFQLSVNPSRLIQQAALIQPFLQGDLSVYFFLKKDGLVICQEYDVFLAANHLDLMSYEIALNGTKKKGPGRRSLMTVLACMYSLL